MPQNSFRPGFCRFGALFAALSPMGRVSVDQFLRPNRGSVYAAASSTRTVGVQMASPFLDLNNAAAHLSRVESALRTAVEAKTPYLTEVASHLLLAGGKRLRPMMAIAAAQVGSDEVVSDEVILAATACELVHLGSLYHDDVMDSSTIRRGVETANSKWGNLQAVVAGDFLLARASSLAANLSLDVSRLLATTIGELCEGQTEEVSTLFVSSRSVDSYLSSIRGKTASLFAASAKLGALSAGHDDDVCDTVSRLAEAYGMVFQIVDDVLDVMADGPELGKPAGHDMRAGVYTLPVLLALADPRGDSGELYDLLSRPLDSPSATRALEIVRSGPGVASSLAFAYRFVATAEELGAALPPSRASEALSRASRMLIESGPAQ